MKVHRVFSEVRTVSYIMSIHCSMQRVTTLLRWSSTVNESTPTWEIRVILLRTANMVCTLLICCDETRQLYGWSSWRHQITMTTRCSVATLTCCSFIHTQAGSVMDSYCENEIRTRAPTVVVHAEPYYFW